MTMKNLLSFLLISVIIVSCESPETPEKDEQIVLLEAHNSQLQREAAEKDSVLYDFVETFATINRNLALIRESEETIRIDSRSTELSGDQRESIEMEIQNINALLQANREKIQVLNETVSRYQGDVGNFKSLIAGLEEQLATKDAEIVTLKKNLVAANFTIDILNKMNEELANEIRMNEGMLKTMSDDANTVYFVVGTFQELKEKGIAERGGILAGKQVQQDFIRDEFVNIDKREITEINLSSMNATILSNHPAHAYSFEGDSAENYQLVINDVDEFWSITSYLIIEIK